ncbi:MAG: hypothetical protein MRJ68_10955 [Nitrospira sp.]|nr:hypothetical protein [Nitrospira sp.]
MWSRRTDLLLQHRLRLLGGMAGLICLPESFRLFGNTCLKIGDPRCSRSARSVFSWAIWSRKVRISSFNLWESVQWHDELAGLSRSSLLGGGGRVDLTDPPVSLGNSSFKLLDGCSMGGFPVTELDLQLMRAVLLRGIQFRDLRA